MRRTTKLLSALLLVLTVLLVTQTVTVSAAEGYKQLNENTFYKGVSKSKAQTISKYTSAVPTDLYNAYKSVNDIYIVKSLADVDADFTYTTVIKDGKGKIAGVIVPSADNKSCQTFILATASTKDIKNTLYTAVGYYLDTNYYGYISVEPIFKAIFNDYMVANPSSSISAHILFSQYFSAYISKSKLPTNAYNFFDALCNPTATTTTSLNTTAIAGYESENIVADKRGTITYKQLSDGILYDTSISDTYVKQAKSWLTSIPKSVMARFISDGWTYIFTDEKLVIGNSNADYYTALCNYRYLVISIRVGIRQASQQNAIHEFGHFVDYTYSNGTYLSNNPDFQALFEKYKSTYKESGSGATVGYATSQATEFFATTFKDYLLYGSKLKTQAPDAYAYMDNLYKTVLQ
jgi:hypothetical protein